MSRRAPYPSLAALYRAGGSIARAADAFARAEDVGAFADTSLEAHPLTADPSFQELLAGQGAGMGVNGVLARLAKDQPGAVAATVTRARGTTEPDAIRKKSGAAPTENASLRQATASAEPAKRGSRTQPAALEAVERALRQFEVSAPKSRNAPQVVAKDAPPVARTVATTPSETTSKRAWTPKEETTTTAAQLPIATPAAPEMRAAVAQILQGAPVSIPAQHRPDTTPGRLSASAVRIEQALTKLGAATSQPDTQTGHRTLETTHTAPGPIHVAQPQSAPRNGIERLLQKARQQKLITEGQAEGAQARLSPEVTDTPDLKTSQRPALKAEPAPPPSPESIAEAMTDLIRREARAAGIDLNGGRK